MIIHNYQSNYNNQIDNSIIELKNSNEKIITINFVSAGIKYIDNYSLKCKSDDLFVKLEEKLYSVYPKLKEYETSFEVRTRRIKRFKTLDENKIKNGDFINIYL